MSELAISDLNKLKAGFDALPNLVIIANFVTNIQAEVGWRMPGPLDYYRYRSASGLRIRKAAVEYFVRLAARYFEGKKDQRL